MNPYTHEQLEVFRLCFKLKAEGCKTGSEAERAVYRQFWNLSFSQIHTLVKHWFFNREKIEHLLNTESITHIGGTT